MQCVPERTNNNMKKVAAVGSCMQLTKSLEQDSCKFNAKDQEANGTVLKASDQRCMFLPFVTLELDLSSRVLASFALPLPGSNHRKNLGSGSQQTIDSSLFYAQPTVLLYIDRQKSRGSYPLDPTCSKNPFLATRFSRPSILGQSHTRVLTKANKISTHSRKQTCVSSDVSSASFCPGVSGCSVSNDQVKEISKPVKNTGKKKIKKKAKQHKKPTSNVKLDTVDEEGNCGSHQVSMDKDYTKDKKGDLNEVVPIENKVSDINGELFDSHTKKTNTCDEIPIDIFSDDYSPPVADSFSDGWNSEGSVHGETRSITITEENFGITPSESGMVSDTSNYSTSSHSVTFGTGCFSRGSSCDASNDLPNNFCISKDIWPKSILDTGSVALSKKGRHSKKSSGSSNGLVHRYGDGENMHGKMGKENNHSVWQKVRRHDGEESICGRKKKDFSQTDSQYGISSNIDSDVSLPKEVGDGVRIGVSDKLIGKPNSSSKFESGIHSRKGLITSKTNLIKPGKRIMYQKESPEISWHVSQQQHKSPNACLLRSPYPQTHSDEAKPAAITCASISNVNAVTEDDNRSPKLETDVCHTEYASQDNSGTILQKWIPVGKNDSGFLNPSRTNNFLKKIGEEELFSNAHGLVYPTNGGASCSSPSFGNGSFQSPSDVGTCEMLSNYAPGSSLGNANSPSNLDYKTKVHGVSIYGCDSNKIVEVVHDAYRFQLASEGVQLATGSPIAEFERLLRSASLVLVPTSGVRPCKACMGNQMIGNSLCMHQIPNISLGGIWQWYEKPGSYGLEVKGEDYHNSKRLGADRYEFHAYFVPYLSAVQLFRRSRSCLPIRNGMANELVGVCKEDRVTASSLKFQHLPILSILLPKPHKAEEISMPQPMDTVSTLDSSGCGQDDEPELLFEYFEFERPQQRRPLFEKIKELVRGDGCSNCLVYGDPSNLDCLDLHDLHPSSWYSVAWYPIYRIPDGNFRAAFLTYHSLGHFVHQSASSDSLRGNSCVVSPVVGLQSYNAQGECWFAPKIQKEENSSLDPSGILKERLRTLEQAASTMARASLRKGDLKYVNRQPDFEFFLSRKR